MTQTTRPQVGLALIWIEELAAEWVEANGIHSSPRGGFFGRHVGVALYHEVGVLGANFDSRLGRAISRPRP